MNDHQATNGAAEAMIDGRRLQLAYLASLLVITGMDNVAASFPPLQAGRPDRRRH